MKKQVFGITLKAPDGKMLPELGVLGTPHDDKDAMDDAKARLLAACAQSQTVSGVELAPGCAIARIFEWSVVDL